MDKLFKNKYRIAVIGLGYVGLPLAVEFGKKYSIIGFDLDRKRIGELKKFKDRTHEVEKKDFKKSKYLKFTDKKEDLRECNIFIIAVPTPILKNFNPDLKYIKSATNIVAKHIKKNDIIIYESTVYPGLTEEICVPILGKVSKLIYNQEFFCGYSPERLNPGDKVRGVSDIVKITSGSNKKTASIVDQLYSSIIKKGTFKASSIKVAEAAKVIENTQRDINIALINELSIIFNKLNIDTQEVLKAARTKWNFQDYRPGLVGGHCIGVDPYYLTYKSKKKGYKPKTILSGRQINNNMPLYVVNRIKEKAKEWKISINKVLIFGFTFKENCPDFRNSLVQKIYNIYIKEKVKVDIFDPIVDAGEVKEKLNIKIISKNKEINTRYYDVLIIAVGHKEFLKINFDKYLKKKSIVFDVKSIFAKEKTSLRL